MTMELTYYTIDNLRAHWSEESWQLARHDTLDEALAAYRALPNTKTRALGMSLGRLYEIDLVQCRPLQQGDLHGDNLLVADYLKMERWRTNPQVLEVVETIREQLSVSRIFTGECIFDIPPTWDPDPAFADKYLDPLRVDNLKSAINEIYLNGEGWQTPERYQRLSPDCSTPYFPYVDRYNIRYVTTTGNHGQADVSPANLHHLTERTKEYLRQRAENRATRRPRKTYEEVR